MCSWRTDPNPVDRVPRGVRLRDPPARPLRPRGRGSSDAIVPHAPCDSVELPGLGLCGGVASLLQTSRWYAAADGLRLRCSGGGGGSIEAGGGRSAFVALGSRVPLKSGGGGGFGLQRWSHR